MAVSSHSDTGSLGSGDNCIMEEGEIKVEGCVFFVSFSVGFLLLRVAGNSQYFLCALFP